jgi:hypothetical protein
MVSTLLLGDCLEAMQSLADSSVDAIVTDPPYGLSFMGKKWDYDVPSQAIWEECLRVLKPGGHLLAFAGTRTQHRMAVRIEDAGFEIRDMIAWVYGSGFPKSLDVSKAIDKRGGNAHLTAEIGAALKAARKARGIGVTEADRTYCGGVTLWSWYEGRPAGQQMPTAEVMSKIANDWPELQRYADAIEEAEREVVGQRLGSLLAVAPGQGSDRNAATLYLTAPATPEAQQWAGWGTALKPALEPITMARKPLEGTVAANVLAHGTGGINVDGCRVAHDEDCRMMAPSQANISNPSEKHRQAGRREAVLELKPGGRWPANLITDGSDEVVALFPQSAGQQGDVRGNEPSLSTDAIYGQFGGRVPSAKRGDTGSAARFFYCAKTSKSERGNGNNHPTVKPIDLMRYLCRLVTPPGGIVLDPFMGSGSTGKAAQLEGFQFIGIERDPQYFAIAQARANNDPIPVGADDCTPDREPAREQQSSLFDILQG